MHLSVAISDAYPSENLVCTLTIKSSVTNAVRGQYRDIERIVMKVGPTATFVEHARVDTLSDVLLWKLQKMFLQTVSLVVKVP